MMLKKMYRSLTVMLVLVTMLSSLCVITSYAQTSVKLTHTDYMPGVEGEAFHDEGEEGVLEVDQRLGITLRGYEWVKFNVPAMEPGEYDFYFTRSSANAVTVSVSVNDEVALSAEPIPTTGGYDTSTEILAGKIVITENAPFVLKFENAGATALYLKEINIVNADERIKKETFAKKSRPYLMSYLPSIIEAENFDSGTQQVAYFDTDVTGTDVYRDNTPVDIMEYDEGGYYVSLIGSEWVKYTYQVDRPGSYSLYFNGADTIGVSILRMYIDDVEIASRIASPTISENKKESLIGTYYLEKGTHSVTVLCADGDISVDYLRFATSKEEGIKIEGNYDLRTWEQSMADIGDVSSEESEETQETPRPVQKELYVVSSAASGGDGSKEKPFRTIKEAQEAVRKINSDMTGDIIVNLEGHFTISETIELKPEDSGSNDFHVVWRGNPDKTVISGGEKITGWQKVEGTELYKTSVDAPDGFRQLYINDNRGTRSRSQWMYWAKAEYRDPETDKHIGYILDKDDFPHEFSNVEELEIIWHPSWKNIRFHAEAFFKDENGDFVFTFNPSTFTQTMTSASYPTLDHPLYFENAPEFLDEPGEWYFNKETQELFYYPASYEDMHTAETYIPRVENLLILNGESIENKVKNIDFEGITFKHGAWEEPTELGFATIQGELLTWNKYIPAQIQVNYGSNINFKENRFRQLGSIALSFSNGTNGCKVEGNIFDDISASAITIGDATLSAKDPLEKYPRNITVKNNLLRRVAVEYMTNQMTAYHTNRVEISHNDILDAPYTGISMGWGWGKNLPHVGYNKISYNRIENVLMRLKDGAHIYTLDASKGSMINDNYCVFSSEWKGGIYHDNSSQFFTSRNNVFDTYKWMKITWHNIKLNTAYNNYSVKPGVVTYPDQNSIQEAIPISKNHDEWPEEVKKIVDNSGLQDKYSYLYDYYNSLENLRHNEVEYLKSAATPGIHIAPGHYMEGGEGVAYHEALGNNNGMSVVGEPGVYDTYNGTGHEYLMITIEGEWTKYEFEVTEDAEYDIYIKASTANEDTCVTVDVDDVCVADTVKLTNTNDYNKFVENKVGTVKLAKGKHIMRVEHAKNNFGFYDITVVKSGETEMSRNDGYNAAILNAIYGGTN